MDLKTKICTIISIDAENNILQNSTFFHDKRSIKSITRRNILQHSQHKSIATLPQMKKNLKQTITLKSGRRKGCLLFLIILHIVIKALAGARRQGEEIKMYKIGKEEVSINLINLIADNMVSQKNLWK